MIEEIIKEFINNAMLDEYGEDQVIFLLLDAYRQGRQDEANGLPTQDLISRGYDRAFIAEIRKRQYQQDY